MPGQGLVERRSHARTRFLGEIEHWHRPRELGVGGPQWPLENRVIAEAGSWGPAPARFSGAHSNAPTTSGKTKAVNTHLQQGQDFFTRPPELCRCFSVDCYFSLQSE